MVRAHRILVVEPDERLRKIRASVLATAGYSVHRANSAEEAVLRCIPGAYHVVLLRGATERETAQLCESIRESNPDQLIFTITHDPVAFGFRDCPTRVFSAFDPGELLDAINQTLRSAYPYH